MNVRKQYRVRRGEPLHGGFKGFQAKARAKLQDRDADVAALTFAPHVLFKGIEIAIALPQGYLPFLSRGGEIGCRNYLFLGMHFIEVFK
jgi:hypothetical protein